MLFFVQKAYATSLLPGPNTGTSVGKGIQSLSTHAQQVSLQRARHCDRALRVNGTGMASALEELTV